MKINNHSYEEYRVGRKLGLESISYLLSKFNNPTEGIKFIHVAGTNGKGSTSAMISGILVDSGYKVGLFTSPHLIKYNERIRIDGDDISDEDLDRILSKIDNEVETMISKGYKKPTKFAVLNVAALLYFKENNVDFAILEVGIGGRYDSTNVIKMSEVAVITSIGYDHTHLLGDTLEKIAYEKAGIIKKNGNVINACKSEEINNVINEVAEENHATVHLVDNIDKYNSNLEGSEFYYKGNKYRLNLIGKYQIYNALTAIKAIEVLSEKYPIEEDSIKRALDNIVFKGRLEIIKKEPIFIIDGAHNPPAVKTLKESLVGLLDRRRAIAIVGFNNDKDYKSALESISSIFNTIIATEPVSDKALDSKLIVDALTDYNGNIFNEKNYKNAVSKALSIAADNDIVVAFGSFYLIGAIKEMFIK